MDINNIISEQIVNFEDLMDASKEDQQGLIWNDIQRLNKQIDIYLDGRKAASKEYIKRKHLQTLSTSDTTDTDYHVWFITICPDETQWTLYKFRKALCRLTTSKKTHDMCYCLEQRGDNPDKLGNGYHAHLLYVTKYYRSTIIYDLRAKFANCNIDVPPRNSDKTFLDRYNYMCGHKTSEKMEKVVMDRIWRDNESIEPIYNFSTITWVEKLSDNNIQLIEDAEEN